MRKIELGGRGADNSAAFSILDKGADCDGIDGQTANVR
jgi:hypothetical protein